MLSPQNLPPNILKCLPPSERAHYGTGSSPTATPQPPPAPGPSPKRRRQQPEQQLQREVLRWWSLTWRALGAWDERLLLHVPNQGIWNQHGGKRRGAVLAGLGLRSGVPDLFLAIPRAGEPFSACAPTVPGLWLELKAGASGRVSEAQKTMHAALRLTGFEVVVARSAHEAIEAIKGYLRR